MNLKEKLNNLTQQPGVYLMKDASKKIIYIGKGKNLKKRVTSYFSNRLKDIKTQALVEKIQHFDIIVTENEIEALILEDNLIKKHLPKYNISLKDDKRYPYLKITIESEDYPKMYITRERKNDKDLYLGPYTTSGSLKEIFKMLNRLFPVKKCTKILKVKKNSKPYFKPVGKPCLYLQLDQCMGLCKGNTDPKQYKNVIHQIILFLKGENKELVNELKNEMKQYSKELKFEKAGLIRDRLSALQDIMEKQKIISSSFESKDIYYINEKNNIFNITVLFIRKGKLIGKDNFIIHNKINSNKQILNDFLKQFYIDSSLIPDEIIIPFLIEDKIVLQKLLKKDKKNSKIKCPYSEIENKLMNMAKENGTITLNNYFADQEYKTRKKELKILKKDINLKREPVIIEGFDISNIQGSFSVGSMVRFTKGIPDKNKYRRFKIKTVTGIDDFKMMHEVVSRRYKRLSKKKKKLPDLILIDGGKGQLSSAKEALDKLELKNLPMISLAKKEELIFQPDNEKPIKLSGKNPGLKLLQRVRDEAHRFAVKYHKLLREKNFIP